MISFFILFFSFYKGEVDLSYTDVIMKIVSSEGKAVNLTKENFIGHDTLKSSLFIDSLAIGAIDKLNDEISSDSLKIEALIDSSWIVVSTVDVRSSIFPSQMYCLSNHGRILFFRRKQLKVYGDVWKTFSIEHDIPFITR